MALAPHSSVPPYAPPTQCTSLQASHPKAPKHVYQNQLRVCADLFLIAGAWFTLAPPHPNIDSIIWRDIDVRGLDGCQNRLLSRPGPGPSPPILQFHGGAWKGHGPRSRGICLLILDPSCLFLGPPCRVVPPSEERATQRPEVRSEVEVYKRGS